jgi:hypothetical protein
MVSWAQSMGCTFLCLWLLALHTVLDGVVGTKGDEVLLKYARAAGRKWKVAGEENNQEPGKGEMVGRAVREVYVDVFLPFMKRALIEGVYGMKEPTWGGLLGSGRNGKQVESVKSLHSVYLFHNFR